MTAPAPAPDFATVLAEIDADLTCAVATRELARRRWAHSPNADTAKTADEAQAWVDELLDRRHAALTH
jgi:hypothetical protein